MGGIGRIAALAGVLASPCLGFAEDLVSQQISSPPPTQRFDWSSAVAESFRFLSIQHGVRLTQSKTQEQLGGPFFKDYVRSVQGLGGWRDGDSGFTNYVAHPMQGAVSGYIQVQNDPKGRTLSFAQGSRYWKSRMLAMAWSAAYSAQFELGPFSEASIGNVGMTPGTMGYVDLVVTPTGGVGMILIEDALDRYVVAPLERRSTRSMKRALRMLFSPNRTAANLLRFRKPWRRDNRDYIPRYARTQRSTSADD